MTALTIRPAESARYDLVALGEVMLRLDPGEGRVRTARAVSRLGRRRRIQRRPRPAPLLRPAHRGRHRVRRQRGRPAARGLHPAGRRRHLARHAGCPTTASAAPSATASTSPNAASASAAPSASPTAATPPQSQLKPGDFDWDHIFGENGVRWFHTGGIFAALSDTTADVIEEAVAAARAHGTIVSYDLNYRPCLWKAIGGLEARPRGQPRDRAARRRDDRQRGGLHRLPRLRGRRRRRATSATSTPTASAR